MALQLLLVLAIACTLCVQPVLGQTTEAPPMQSPIRPYPALTGADERVLRLQQDPALLELAAMIGETVLIEINGAQQTAIVQEGVNAYIDCFPWLSRFPGGTTVWYIQDLDENGMEISEPALTERTPEDQIATERRVVGGPFNRWLNITGTLIVQGAEDPHFGRYICSTCFARGTAQEQCHNATLTLFLVGAPPELDKAPNNDPEEFSTPTRPVYRIGADFCLERESSMQTVTIRCAILSGDTDVNRPTTFPAANRTWTMDDIVVTDNLDGDDPMFEEEFLMTGNKSIFTPGLINPTAFDVNFPSGNIVLDTTFFNLSNAMMAPPGVNNMNLRDFAFEELLGTYECSVQNVYGGDSATSVVRECGDAPVVPGCDGGTDETLVLAAEETAPVGCNVCISGGSGGSTLKVNLNCTAIEGTGEISYMWTGPVAGSDVISREALLTVSMEGEYNCTASNMDLPDGVQLTTNVFFSPLAEFEDEIIDRFGSTVNGDGCDRLRGALSPAPDLCVFLGETLNLECVDSVNGSPLDIMTDDGMRVEAGSMVLDDETATNFTFLCMLETNTPCGNVASMISVQVFDPAAVNRSSMLAPGEIGAGRSTSVEMVEEGAEVTLSCPVMGIDDPQTQWFRIETDASGVAVEVPINDTDPAYSVSVTAEMATLTIESYNGTEDDGIYVCRTSNIAGEDAAIVALSSTPDEGEWMVGDDSECNVNCNSGVRVRSVVCRSRRDGRLLPNSECPVPRPDIQSDCSDLFPQDCFLDPIFITGEFGPCSLDCKGGFRKRTVSCVIPMTEDVVADQECFPLRKPADRELCPNTCCVSDTYSFCKQMGPSLCSMTFFQQSCCWSCLLRVIP